MKKNILFFLVLCSSQLVTTAQENKNYDFEIVENDFAKSWDIFGNGDHAVTLVSNKSQSGKNAILISSEDAKDSFKAIGFTIPSTFGGKKIKLTGYVKAENITGSGGLWMRIDPQLGFDNMLNRPIKGTTDWTKYEVELDLKAGQAQQIVVGGLLSGAGKMWIDNLEVIVDGKPIEKAAPKKLDEAQKDKEFDNGSSISLSNLTQQQVVNATILGKVWGFLKYHHPEIASGNYNWDYELFRVMEPIILAENASERDFKILEWINNYGAIKPCKKCKETAPDAVVKPDHRWMNSATLSEALQKKLQYIYNNRHQGKQYYIGEFSGVGNPEFKNENSYTSMPYPDSGFRLLTLYRLWNSVHYFSPNREITDKDWDMVLKEYVPEFVGATNELEFELASIELIGEMKDTHSNLWAGANKFSEMKGNKYPPVHLRFIDEQLVVTDFYNPEMKANIPLAEGDVILEIDGVKVSEIVKEKLRYYPASNRPSQLRDLSGDILRSNKSELLVKTLKNNKPVDLVLPLFKRDQLNIYNWYPQPEGKSYRKLEGNIGYITLANITEEDPKEIVKEFINCKGLIIDIRNYPSAFMPFALGQFIAPKGTEFVKFTTLNTDNPGEFTFGKPLSIGAGNSVKKKFEGPVVVLVNELSQSQAEYTAMAFRAAPNTTVIGSTTAGADGNVSAIPLPGGMRTMISGIGVYYPDGSPTQRVGIVPDIQVLPTIDGIKEGRDELLDKAIEIINNYE